jgi:hypothetical protein
MQVWPQRRGALTEGERATKAGFCLRLLGRSFWFHIGDVFRPKQATDLAVAKILGVRLFDLRHIFAA